jgi:ribose-phosphate pyrophosphokinase
MNRLAIIAGRANRPLAEATAFALGIDLIRCTVDNFPDDELRIEIHESVRGRDVYVLQPTNPPVAEHVLELLLLADACQRAGAARVIAVIPYFGYARQDRRTHGRQPVSARLLADLLCTRFKRIVTVDIHNPSAEGFFTVPLEHLSAITLLVEIIRPLASEQAIIVAPDLGAVKLAQRYADLLDLPVAYVHKVRTSDRKVSVRRVIGEVKDRYPIVVDDMISTADTMISAFDALLDRGCAPEIIVAASHGLFVGDAVHRFASLPVRRMVVTDSVYRSSAIPLPLEVVSLSQVLAEAIQRLHSDSSLRGFLSVL